ncbi:Gfo/Idh/MocA family oxidoreductase [Candidatus Woesearchaeota archaeon]|nr:Gfo/Idh/MocA family oxidoreductase [Candidatus Woesearchaeota archaeon]
MVPLILLIGCGKFGKHHLRVLQQFEKQKKIKLKGVVVATSSSAQKITKEFGIPTFSSFEKKILQNVDAVVITTPATTHSTFIKQCLPQCHVFVEKPLALHEKEIQELQKLSTLHKKTLFVGHIFRFNKAVKELKKMVLPEKEKLYHIEGNFLGQSIPQKDCGVLPTILHFFDIFDFLFETQPLTIYAQGKKIKKNNPFHDFVSVDLLYPTFTSHLSLGWVGAQKERSLLFRFTDKDIFVELLEQTITIIKEGKKKKMSYAHPEPLVWELHHFLDVLQKKENTYPNIDLALRIQKIISAGEKSLVTGETVKL